MISWLDSTNYFLTSSTFLHFPYFKTDEQKTLVLRQILVAKKRYALSDVVFSIAINHYHVKFFLPIGKDLPRVKQIINGGTSYQYRRRFKMEYQRMWQTSKTYQIVSEEMNWKVTGYIIGNLLKHKEVSTFGDLKENPFSSFGDVADALGEETARLMVYSTINLNENAEESVRKPDFDRLKSIGTPAKAG